MNESHHIFFKLDAKGTVTEMNQAALDILDLSSLEQATAVWLNDLIVKGSGLEMAFKGGHSQRIVELQLLSGSRVTGDLIILKEPNSKPANPGA